MLVTEQFRTADGTVVGALIRHWTGTSLHTLVCVERTGDTSQPARDSGAPDAQPGADAQPGGDAQPRAAARPRDEAPAGEPALHAVESRIEFDSSDPFSFTHLVHLTPEGTHRISRAADAPADVLPGYAEFLVVRALAEADAGDSHEQVATVLDEATGELVPSIFRREGDQIVRRVGDQVQATHEVRDGQVVQTDWGDGFVSVVVLSEDDVLESVPHRVQQRTARFLDDIERK